MEGDRRREQIYKELSSSRQPVSGMELAKKFGVSRQIIVQDIALLRAVNKNILSTNKGYVLYIPQTEAKARRSFPVCHTDGQIRDELYTIVDCGGTVLDVVIAHDIYGQITVDLLLKNRTDVDEFTDRIEKSASLPLKELTGGEHWHTVEADTPQILDYSAEKLKEKGYFR